MLRIPKLRFMPRSPRLLRLPSTTSILGSLIRSLLTPANEYIQTNSQRNKFEHREVAESILGRKLLPGEVVHHINGKKYDNRPKNLCVMSSRDHERYHAWYDWIHATYGVYPRRETQLKKLREAFKGRILSDFTNTWFR
jgi:hypothetical protein